MVYQRSVKTGKGDTGMTYEEVFTQIKSIFMEADVKRGKGACGIPV